MVPLFKLLSLIIKVFTRPIVNYLKGTIKDSHDKNRKLRIVISGLGQKYHVLNLRVQRRFTKMSGTTAYIKPLTEDKAIESGAELVGETLGYSLLVLYGYYEINRMSFEGKRKESTHHENLSKVHARIDNLEQEYEELRKVIEAKINSS